MSVHCDGTKIKTKMVQLRHAEHMSETLLFPRLLLMCMALAQVVSGSALLLNESFHTLDNWVDDINGDTGVIKLMPESDANDPAISHTVFTNITRCPAASNSDTCYRAELATLQALRPLLFPNCSLEYWLGFSSIIPADWNYDENGDSLVYNFQLHGGVNDGKPPNLGIRIQDNEMTANVCGSKGGDDLYCEYYKLGVPSLGTYTDWVIHSKLSYEKSASAPNGDGFINIWRNNVQLVAASNILTSYNQTDPPYMKFGSYVESWKVASDPSSLGINWASVTYKALRLGDQGSYYDEVYTGDGAPCGSPCDDLLNPDDTSPLFTLQALELLVIPLGCVIIFSTMFYWAAMSQRSSTRKNQRQHGLLKGQIASKDNTTVSQQTKNVLLLASLQEQGDDGVTSKGDPSTSGTQGASAAAEPRSAQSHSYSSSRYFSGINSFKLWWAEYNEEGTDNADEVDENGQHRPSAQVADNIDADVAHSHLWQASRYRRAFWYCFGYLFLIAAVAFAAILYGRPVAHTKGLLPWTRLQNWTAVQAGLIAVSGVMMIVYFLPLAYLPHDFVAGRAFKNDPNFLRKIGVVIPCHKSAAEIAEVIRRVLLYIPAENIVICDNGNFTWPADNTFAVVKAVHPSIRYCFIQQGHKTRALWTGAHRLPAHCEYIMHLDDDTQLSEHMVFDESHFKGEKNENFVIAVAFLRSSHKTNGVTKFTDFWYKITDHFHGTQAIICTRCFVPGPAGLWKRSKFLEIFGLHPSLPFGEDIFGGFTTLNSGYAIRTENRCMVTTFAPPILTNFGGFATRSQGYGASSLWKQRAHRWTVSALRITGKSLYSFFTYDSRGGVLSNIAFRLYRFREYKIIMVQLIYVPFCFVILARGFIVEFFLLKFMLFLLPLVRNLCINYVFWRHQPELQVDLRTVLLSPFYNFFLICCAIHGRWKCLLWYLPNVPANHGMLQRLRPEPMSKVLLASPALAALAPPQASKTQPPLDLSQSHLKRQTSGTQEEDTELRTQSPHSPRSESVADEASPGSSRGGAFSSRGTSSTNLTSGASSPSKAVHALALPEQIVTTRDDVFELFDKDGPGSSLYLYTPQRVNSV